MNASKIRSHGSRIRVYAEWNACVFINSQTNFSRSCFFPFLFTSRVCEWAMEWERKTEFSKVSRLHIRTCSAWWKQTVVFVELFFFLLYPMLRMRNTEIQWWESISIFTLHSHLIRRTVHRDPQTLCFLQHWRAVWRLPASFARPTTTHLPASRHTFFYLGFSEC